MSSKADRFPGTMVSQLGTTQIKDGRVTAEGFSFGGSVDFGGAAWDISVHGTINGNQISGTIDSSRGRCHSPARRILRKLPVVGSVDNGFSELTL